MNEQKKTKEAKKKSSKVQAGFLHPRFGELLHDRISTSKIRSRILAMSTAAARQARATLLLPPYNLLSVVAPFSFVRPLRRDALIEAIDGPS